MGGPGAPGGPGLPPAGGAATASALEGAGADLVGVVAPVSATMLLTVALVRALIPHGAPEGSAAVGLAQAYYQEREGDPAGTKFAGALVNALVFVAVIGGLTTVLFLLFKYRCYRLISGYMAFSGFAIYFLLAGSVLVQLFAHWGWRVDLATFTFVLYNFATVGVLAVFFQRAPIALKQGYLVLTGTITAFVFSYIPAWTTWVLLVAMALYDLVAVLCPMGPLKALVELAQERDEDIPALVYETRPSGRPGAPPPQGHAAPVPAAMSDRAPGGEPERGAAPAPRGGREGAPVSVEGAGARAAAGARGDAVSASGSGEEEEEQEGAPLIAVPPPRRGIDRGEPGGPPTRRASGGLRGAAGGGGPDGGFRVEEAGEGGEDDGEEEELYELPDSIKLGLGDFIFYSVMVGRASMYDMMTAFACFFAILAGLGATLVLLAVYRKALPALPISIALGVAFYFLTRLCLEPFAAPLASQLLYV